MNRNVLVAALTATLLTACGGGGGGGGGDDLPDSRPEGAAKGIAQHGPIVNAEISAYDWDGSRGDHRGTTRTDGEGKYSLDISVSDRPLLIGSREGSYSEESTGRSVQMGNDELTAVIFYESGRDVDVQLTYFTTLATCRAEYLIKEEGQTVGNAINQANNEWSAILGVDIVGVQPVDVTKSSAFTPFMTPSHQYGVALAGVSELVEHIRVEQGGDENNTSFSTKYLTKVACEDLRFNGELDGLSAPTPGNPSGQLYIGSTALNIDLYRRALGQGVIAFGENENNKTGLVASDFLELANGIAISSSAVFGGVEGTPVDNEGPIVTSTIAAGSLLNGTAEVPFEVSDPLGVKTVSFYIDDALYAEGQPANPTLNWITTAYSDGEHIVRVVATDVLDNETSEEFTFTVANAGPSLTFTSSVLVNATAYTATGAYSAVIAGVDRIEVNGVEAILNEDEGTWSANISLDGGVNEIEAIIYDELNNTSTEEISVRVDLFAPQIQSRDTLATLTNYDGLLNTCESVLLNNDTANSRPICLNAEKASLSGQPITYTLYNDGYLVLGVDFIDPQGTHGVFSDVEDITLEYQVQLNGQVLVDWALVPRPDSARSYAHLPVTTEYFGEDFYQVSREDDFTVIFRATDAASSSASLAYEFQLDVLTPPFELATTVANTGVFSTAFASRTVLNGAQVNVEYSWFNASLPYMIKVDSSESHNVNQTYESAQRVNSARFIGNDAWSGRFAGIDSGGCASCTASWESPGGWVDVDSVVSGGNTLRPSTRTSVGSYQRYDTAVVTPPSPGEWSTYSSGVCRDYREIYSKHDDRFYGAGFRSGEGYACRRKVDDNGTSSSATFRRRTVYSVEYEPGYPRNEFNEYLTSYPFNDSVIRVFNVTNAVEIQPQDGWYAIPTNVEVRIVKQVTLPYIANYLDARVSQNAATVPFGYEVYEDLALAYDIDTDITITRAINPGSPDEVDEVSQTLSNHGSGISSYNLSRG